MIHKRESEINALVRLLDDPSDSIYENVSKKLYSFGVELIPVLQNKFEESKNELQQERLAIILDDLKLEKLHGDLEDWMGNHADDLLEGCVRIARYGHPNLDEQKIREDISSIADRVKALMPFKNETEAINTMNKVILEEFGFQGNVREYSHVDNSFINRAVANKVGNPIMLSVIYLLVAKELDIPIIGINSPAHFLLAFAKKDADWHLAGTPEMIDNIVFYVDPFYSGRVYDHGFFDNLLINANFDLKNRIDLVATNGDIIRRIMNNLIYGLHLAGERSTAQDLLEIIESL